MVIIKQIVKTSIALGVVALSLNVANAEGDAAKGEKIFKKCKSCHAVGEGAKNKIGPVLTGVVGRPAASFEGYKYDKALLAVGEAGIVWNEEEISAFISDPKAYVRAKTGDEKAKSKMSFKLKDEQQRKDVIAYLATFSKPAE